MRLTVLVLGTEVLAIELGRTTEPPALEGGSGGQFELADPELAGGDAFGFRIS